MPIELESWERAFELDQILMCFHNFIVVKALTFHSYAAAKNFSILVFNRGSSQ
jgi:hypothetical protein